MNDSPESLELEQFFEIKFSENDWILCLIDVKNVDFGKLRFQKSNRQVSRIPFLISKDLSALCLVPHPRHAKENLIYDVVKLVCAFNLVSENYEINHRSVRATFDPPHSRYFALSTAAFAAPTAHINYRIDRLTKRRRYLCLPRIRPCFKSWDYLELPESLF